VNAGDRVGFMQGRLSPLVDGRIQAFPWAAWKDEFPIAEKIGLRLMEWTLDQDRLYENPLLDPEGQAEIQKLCRRHRIAVPSLTGDCFMQAPFWKADAAQGKALKDDFVAIANACASVGIYMIVVPLVDNGRLDTRVEEDALVEFLQAQSPFLAAKGLHVLFESDFAPKELARFIDRLAPGLFGINYDIGNSAALGFRPREEFAAYGPRIVNVHVKDRVLGGTTVPLGTGNADFDTVFEALAGARYQGNFILQTARAQGEGHAETLSAYRDMVLAWMLQFGLAVQT
jgi:L-ribulose-5-phosphate 3-epimerase